MARATLCDVCEKEAEIAFRLYIVPPPFGRGQKGNSRNIHARYSGWAEVGQCCAKEALGKFKWTKRQRRKSGDTPTTVA